MNATYWAALGFGIPVMSLVATFLVLDFRGHVTDVRAAIHDPDACDGPALARAVAARLRARQAQEAGPSSNLETQAMPPLVPTGIVRFWRGDRELIAVEGVAWDEFAPLVVCRDPDRPDVWCVIHRAGKGSAVLTGYEEPEDAMAAIGRLSEVCDWASPEAIEQWEQLKGEMAA